jgi:hypothetical protein
VVYPENRDEFEQKGTKDTKRTTCNSKPVHLWGEAIRGTFFYGSALLCVLCALLFNFPFSRLGLLQWMEGYSFIRREFTGPIQAAAAK